MVVALGIVAVLAAVLVPIVGNYIGEARVTRANKEAQSIADAILNFNKSTGKWPIFKPPAANITTTTPTYVSLESPGTAPACSVDCTLWLPAAAADKGSISDILERNVPGYTTSGKFAWRGPYLTDVGSDPWGNKYVVAADNLKYGVVRAGLVLSAGPNGTIETTFAQNIGSGSAAVSVGGDDIVARIR